MLKITIIVTSVIVFLFVGSAGGQQLTNGKVIGTMFDPNDAVILGNEVIVTQPGFQKSVIPNPETGEFAFDLKPGIYSITNKQTWWFGIRRALFVVKENETTIINLSPTLRVLSVALEVTRKGSQDVATYNYTPSYEDFLPFPDSTLNVVIEYRTKKTKGSVSEYKNAKLTYNNYSVNATTLKFDKKTLTFEARGNVKSDENGHRKTKDILKSRIEKL